MDRLSFLGHPNDEADVDSLLSQLSDEHAMKLKVNSHSKYNKYPALDLGTGKWSHKDDDDVDLDPELSSRLANLKAGPIKKSSVATRSNGNETTEGKKENTVGLGLPRSSSKREDGSGGGIDRRLSRSQSNNSDRSSGGDNADDEEDIDANLIARFRALKETPSPNSSDTNLVQSSDNLSSLKDASSDHYSPSSYEVSSPSTTLLGRSISRSSPRVLTTSVATSCHCSTPSPLKLLKQLSSKQIPSTSALVPTSPTSNTSSAASRRPGKGKPAGKESSSKKISQDKNQEAEAENFATMTEVKRLLSSVADRVGLEGNRVSSAEEDECLSGDERAFSLLDREREYLKVSSEEEKLNREAERVVEWARDAARLGIDATDGEDEDLEVGEDEVDSDSSTDKRIKMAKDLKKATKLKRKKKWGLF